MIQTTKITSLSGHLSQNGVRARTRQKLRKARLSTQKVFGYVRAFICLCLATQLTFLQCDILAASGEDFTKAEAECKQIILEAGGKLIDEFIYPGGFLYQISPGTNNPLQCGDEIVGGGYIQIADWAQFPRPRFNGLRLAPYGGAGEYLLLPVPPHRSRSLARAASMRTAWRRSALVWENNTKKRASIISWLSGWAREYSGGMG